MKKSHNTIIHIITFIIILLNTCLPNSFGTVLTNDYQSTSILLYRSDNAKLTNHNNSDFIQENCTILDTIPQNQSSSVLRSNINGRSISIRKENGQIVELMIDGEIIPPSEYKNHKDLMDNNIQLDLDSGFNWNHKSMNLDSFLFKGDFDSFSDLYEKFNLPQNDNFYMFDHDDFMNLDQMLDSFGNRMKTMQFDTIIRLGPDNLEKSFRFQFDDNEMLSPYKTEGLQYDKSTDTVIDKLGDALNKDGLLEPNKTNTIILTGTYLKINGAKQPKNIWTKYKRIYELQIGTPMSKRARIDFSVMGIKSDRKLRSF